MLNHRVYCLNHRPIWNNTHLSRLQTHELKEQAVLRMMEINEEREDGDKENVDAVVKVSDEKSKDHERDDALRFNWDRVKEFAKKVVCLFLFVIIQTIFFV